MDERKEGRKAKWEEPEIEDFQQETGEAREDFTMERPSEKHGCRPQFGGCRPQSGGCRPQSGGCRPWYGGGGCFPFSGGSCMPRRGCYPRILFFSISPYCRPYGFNYGYGCFPRR